MKEVSIAPMRTIAVEIYPDDSDYARARYCVECGGHEFWTNKELEVFEQLRAFLNPQ